MKFIITLFSLLLLVSCGNPAPGSDTSTRTYQVQHSGVATVTGISRRGDETYIDFLWQAENNTGEAERFVVNSRAFHGLDQPDAISTGDKLHLDVLHSFQQRGSTTPQRTESRWSLSRPEN